MPVAFAVGLFVAGAVLGHHYPSLHTSGAQLLVWGFFISTVVCYHATYTINSLSHVFGWRRYDTGDDSRNNPLIRAILSYIPGTLFVSFVVPAVIKGGLQPAVGTVATLLVMIYSRNLALAIIAGVAAAWGVWALG